MRKLIRVLVCTNPREFEEWNIFEYNDGTVKTSWIPPWGTVKDTRYDEFKSVAGAKISATRWIGHKSLWKEESDNGAEDRLP